MDILHLFVDGSFEIVNDTLHAGVVVIKNNEIIAENCVSTKNLKKNE